MRWLGYIFCCNLFVTALESEDKKQIGKKIIKGDKEKKEKMVRIL